MNEGVERAARRRRGQEMRRDYLSRLSKSLGLIVHHSQLLTLEQTDRLVERMRASSEKQRADAGNGHFECRSSSLDAVELRTAIQRLLNNNADELVVLMIEQSEFCGGIEASFHYVLSRALRFMAQTKARFTVTCRDGSAGMSLTMERDEAGAPQVMLTVWGVDWVESLQGHQAVS